MSSMRQVTETLAVKKRALPYFDEILERQQTGDPAFNEAFARNVHFGYWHDPDSSDPTLNGYALASEELSRQVFRFAGIANAQSVIDIGCGFGGMLAKLGRDFENLTLVGLNVDPRQIHVAERVCQSHKPAQKTRFVLADATSTGEPAERFDVALAIEVIFHLSSREAFFREMNRILKPGGILLVSEIVLNPPRLPTVFWQTFKNLPQLGLYKKSIGDIGRPVTTRNYCRLATKYGFTIEAVEDWSANVQPSFSCLKNLHALGAQGEESLYSPKLLEFASNLLESGAQRYIAVRLRKK